MGRGTLREAGGVRGARTRLRRGGRGLGARTQLWGGGGVGGRAESCVQGSGRGMWLREVGGVWCASTRPLALWQLLARLVNAPVQKSLESTAPNA